MINRRQIKNGAIQFRTASNESEMISLSNLFVGDIVQLTSNKRRYELEKLPATNISNWRLLLGIKSGTFNANVSQTLYQDTTKNLTISWDGTNKQPTYTVSGWGWHDGSSLKIDGNSSKIRVGSGDRSSSNGTFYFTNSGTLNTSYNMENYGSYMFSSLIKESFDTNFPAIMIHINIGNTGSGAYIINIIN